MMNSYSVQYSSRTGIFARGKCGVCHLIRTFLRDREARLGLPGSSSTGLNGMKNLRYSAIGALCVVVVAALCTPTFAVGPCPIGEAVDCNNCEFKTDDMTVAVGDINQTLVVHGIHDVCILGFMVSLEADGAKIELTGVGAGSSIGDVDFENGGISPDASKVIYGVVFDLTEDGFATKNLPPGDDEIAEVTFNVIAVSETTTSLEFSDILIPELSGTTARNLMTNVQGFTIRPELSAGTITILDPVPTVHSIAPSTGVAGDMVKIVGENFDQGDLQVTICGSLALVQSVDANIIQVTVPTCGVEECVDVAVATVAGSVVKTEAFCYLPSCVPDEPGFEKTCDDGIDNDCDEAVDGTDADCEPTCLQSESNEVTCDDGVDNDCDGDIDEADSDCPSASVGPFIRGDCDGNGKFGGSPTEAIVGLQFSFRGGDEPPCLAACDAEANGSLGVTDYLRILRAAFLGLGEPDAPFPDCAVSGLGTDILLGCQTPPECQ